MDTLNEWVPALARNLEICIRFPSFLVTILSLPPRRVNSESCLMRDEPSRFPVHDPKAMSPKHKIGDLLLPLAMSVPYLRRLQDSQSGMWVFRRSILRDLHLQADGMAFSEEIRIEALRTPGIRFEEISIQHSSRLGEKKLNAYRLLGT
jgi:hypothetical protein